MQVLESLGNTYITGMSTDHKMSEAKQVHLLHDASKQGFFSRVCLGENVFKGEKCVVGILFLAFL